MALPWRAISLVGLIWLSLTAPVGADEKSSTMMPDARRAHEYLTQVCRIGTRVSGSIGMDKQQKLIAEHFAKFNVDPQFQSFDTPHPLTGAPVRMTNLIVSWNPEARERVLLACHYDTRPLPDRDPNPQLARSGTFIGANDGASGVALFMELAHHMQGLKPTYGVDFVFFDGEELIYGKSGEYFIGSEYFAKAYKETPPAHRYVYGVVVDMIADRNLNIYMEVNSLRYAPELTESIWSVAKQIGVREFIPRRGHEVRDDHLPLNDIARIPTCDIIDFDYPHWHTTRDTAAACSGTSLAKVGRVLLTWLQNVPAPPAKR